MNLHFYSTNPFQKPNTTTKQSQAQNADIQSTMDQDVQMKTITSTSSEDINAQSLKLNDENNRELLRLIQQYLNDQGYSEVAQELQRQSKVRMEEEVINEFRGCVTSGEYAQARELVRQRIDNGDGTWAKQVEYMLWEQEYMEMLEAGRRIEAVNIMQKEMMPRIEKNDIPGRQRMHGLAQLLMCGGIESTNNIVKNGFNAVSSELRRMAPLWKGSGPEGRKDLLNRLQSMLPSTEMLQPHRLEHLVKQGLQNQFFNCKFHNVSTFSSSSTFSLLEDHICDKQNMIPTKCIGILSKHKDEVWQVKFSPSGSKIATIGKDNVIHIWSITKLSTTPNAGSNSQKSLSNSGFQSSQKGSGKYRVKFTHEIKGHSKQINCINWSYNNDDKWIVTASHDQTAKVWDASRTGKLVVEITRHQEAVQAACFLNTQSNEPNNSKLITAAVDKLVILWEIKVASQVMGESSSGPFLFEAVELARIETRNYLDIAVASNRLVLSGQTHFQVFTYQSVSDLIEVMNDRDLPYEVEASDSPLTSIALSRDGRFLLTNQSMKNPKLELYDLGAPLQHGSRKAEIVKRFKGGHLQTQFVLRCCFGGGQAEQFVLCGSEDATVSLWHREKGEIITKIAGGHTQTINSVSWSPVDPQLFVTASDDHTLRLWGTEAMQACDLVTDAKDIRRVDVLKTGFPGAAGGGRNYIGLQSDDDDDEDFEEEEQRDEYDEEAMEDEEHMIFRTSASATGTQSARVLQATRILPPGIREEEVEDDEEEGEGEDEWGRPQPRHY